MSISGTASILPNGETVHLGDIEKQISYSFEVVQGLVILLSSSPSWTKYWGCLLWLQLQLLQLFLRRIFLIMSMSLGQRPESIRVPSRVGETVARIAEV